MILNYKGCMEGGRVVDRTNDLGFKVESKSHVEEEEDRISMREVVELNELDFFLLSPSTIWRQNIEPKDGFCWSSDPEDDRYI